MLYTKDACVIGGGLMGLATAYYLSRAGKSVVLLEQREIGNGASGSCDDMILLQSKKPGVTLKLALESLSLYRNLSKELDWDIGFSSHGGMILIQNGKELAVMEKFVQKQRECGLDVTIVDQKELRRRQPHVREDILASTYSSVDSQVDPLRLMHAFLRRSMDFGMVPLRHAPVTAIEKTGSHWMVSSGNEIRVECDYVINAAGAWASQIGKLTGLEIPIEPRRGQLAITEQIPPIGETNVWTASYVASKIDPSLAPDMSSFAKSIGLGFSFTQTHDGNYLIGSTREAADFDKTTSQQAITNIMKQACSYFPILKSVNVIRTISGFRPASKDGLPIVSQVDHLPGYYICAGHEGDGVALAPITGKNLADLIITGHCEQGFNELSFSRFSA
ncbi:MAG TPA: FAD-dependent oxidoreductase [Clostridia bacterium]|nr:FAD-dependent oxidoreductase [Clostridia bacterium]